MICLSGLYLLALERHLFCLNKALLFANKTVPLGEP